MRYEIAVEKNNECGYQLNYVGAWSCGGVTKYHNLEDALDLIDEWGYTIKGNKRKINKLGIYDHEDDYFINAEKCFHLIKEIKNAKYAR